MAEPKDEIIKFGDIKFVADQGEAGGRAYKDRGRYEEFRNPLYDDLRAVLNPSWVIDIGANYGLTVLFASRLFPDARIIAAEPIPRLADYIRRNAAQNVVDKLSFFEGIVGRESGGTSTFHVLENSTQDSRVKSPGPNWTPITVPQTTLDDLAEGIADGDGVYVKIDTQGYEEQVFRGGESFLKRNRRWIVKTEFAPAWLRSQGADPVELLRYLVDRYIVCEAMARTPYRSDTLADATVRWLAHRDLEGFLDHVTNLNRNGLGWVDLLIVPHELHRQLRFATE